MPTRTSAGVKMPSTLKRSSAKAQRTYAETLEHAEAEYGPGERAGRTAYASLKHGFEKVGDHWEAKARKGPSDPEAATRHGDKAQGQRETFGGVDVLGHTKPELMARARALGVVGRSGMSKEELGRAIARKQRNAPR